MPEIECECPKCGHIFEWEFDPEEFGLSKEDLD